MCGDVTELKISEKVDAYLALYENQMENYRSKVNLEWRVSFGAWTLLVALIYVASSQSLRIGNSAYFVFSVPVLHILWLYFIQRTQDYDKTLWVAYRQRILQALDGSDTTIPGSEPWEGKPVAKYLQWFLLEAGVTVILSFVAFQQLVAKVAWNLPS